MSSPFSLEIEIGEILYISPKGKTYDLRSEFLDLFFTESIFVKFVRGYITFQDLNGITEFNQGYSGGYLKIKYRTNEAFPWIDQLLWVYKSGPDQPQEQTYQFNRRIFTFFFTSPAFYMNLYERYCVYYPEMFVHEIAQKVCKDFLQIDLKTIDQTKDRTSFLTDFSWTPCDVIDQLISRSFSMSNQDPGYIFYQSNQGYHYVSLYEILKRSKKWLLTMHPPGENVRNDYFHFVGKILEFKIEQNINYINSWDHHRFGGTIHYVDVMDKRFQKIVHDYPSYLQKTMNLGTKSVSTTDHQNTKAFTMPEYCEGFEREYVLPNFSRYDLVKDNQLVVKCPGDSRKQCGDITEVRFLSKSQNDLVNKMLEGNYMISEIEHHITLSKKYYQTFKLFKDGMNFAYNALSTGASNP